MRAPSHLAAAAALVFAVTPTLAYAGTRVDPTGSRTVELVHGFWSLVSDAAGPGDTGTPAQVSRPAPQAIAPATSSNGTVDLRDLSKPAEVESNLREALRPESGRLHVTIPGGTARLGDFSIGSNETVSGPLLVVRGTADVYGKLLGNVVTVDGDVVLHPGGVISGDILTFGGDVRDEGGEIGGEVRTLRAASILTAPLATAPPPPRVVSDTVSHSFGRAFVSGLLGQILLLPTFGMLVVGLVLSVAGILLLPFAVVVYVLLVVVGAVGGYLAVAHAMGETYTRRRLALGVMIGSPNSYRYLIVGLGALAALWMAWALFGWVPVAGNLIRGAAILVTWLLATAGFGAALLSRAGIRENFAGRLIPPEALTDEYLWATPQFGVPAARRPGTRTPTRGL
jgi:hypothetical protein